MKRKPKKTKSLAQVIEEYFERLAQRISKFAGSSLAFVLAVFSLVLWGFFGLILNFTTSWELTINIVSIVTFLMVFLIQRAQNKDSLGIHMKLNEIIASMGGASNRLIDVENLSEKDLELLGKHYSELAITCNKEYDKKKTHSIEEAVKKHGLEFSTDME
jgi:low affinity Fe/Cu permease